MRNNQCQRFHRKRLCYELTRSGRAQLNKNEKRGHFRKGFKKKNRPRRHKDRNDCIRQRERRRTICPLSNMLKFREIGWKDWHSKAILQEHQNVITVSWWVQDTHSGMLGKRSLVLWFCLWTSSSFLTTSQTPETAHTLLFVKTTTPHCDWHKGSIQ